MAKEIIFNLEIAISDASAVALLLIEQELEICLNRIATKQLGAENYEVRGYELSKTDVLDRNY